MEWARRSGLRIIRNGRNGKARKERPRKQAGCRTSRGPRQPETGAGRPLYRRRSFPIKKARSWRESRVESPRRSRSCKFVTRHSWIPRSWAITCDCKTCWRKWPKRRRLWLRCTRVGRSWNSNRGEGFIPDSQGAANNAAPTITNRGCLGRNVRTPVKRKDDFALVTIVSRLAGAIGVGLELVGHWAGTVNPSQSGNARWRLHWQSDGDKGTKQ